LLDNWSKPVSISNQINTLSNESYPFLLLDGVTLFYASDSEESLGGYDIFMTRYSANSKTYLNSENIGMPFNSPYNDYMMVINELNKIGWFATDRNQVKDSIVIYQFEYNDPKKYFRSEDLEEQRQVARLAKYRKLDNIDFSNQTSTQINVKNKTPDCSDFVLVINDSTRYDCLEQIQSETALNKIKEWLIIKENQSQRKNELDKLRNDYALTENEDQKQKLKEKIISNEQQYFETEVILKNKLIEATNEEIKFIRIN
jgi:hypothetical protein